MSAQAGTACESTETIRNRFRERRAEVRVDTYTLRIPKFTYFSDGLVARWSRAVRVATSAVAETGTVKIFAHFPTAPRPAPCGYSSSSVTSR